MRKTGNIILSLITVIIVLTACVNNPEKEHQGIINLDHLKHLYTALTLENGKEVGVINIYSEYPDYFYEIEPNEGFTCVDDVARALVFLSAYTKNSNEPEIEIMIDKMTRFILTMQAENGYFYNFLWGDMSINKSYKTSVAEPNWWSWRALWALSEIYPNLEGNLADRIKTAADKIISIIEEKYTGLHKDTVQFEGINLPNWFPLGTAFDQSAILIMGMESYYNNIQKDTAVIDLIEKFAEGLLLTQKGDSNNFPYGAYLSWNNLWHAYGNIQAYSMLKAGQLLNRKDYIESALLEIDYFYPFLMKENFPAYFSIKKADGWFKIIDHQQFPQIAYGFRPMIWACIEAFIVTGEEKYLQRAEEISEWFSGKNITGKRMYDPATGRCYDGIVSETEVNRNSGAESTIEALLSLQAFDQIKHK